MGLLLATLAGLGNVAGGLLVAARRHWPKRALVLMVAVGAGFLVCVAMLRMLPRAMELHPGRALPLVATGYFLIHLFEHVLVPHFHFGEEVHADVVHGRSSLAAVVGLALHSLFDGISIAAGWHFSSSLGWIVFIGIALHKVPEGFTVASIVRAAGGGRGGSLGAAAIVGAACLVGALLVAGRPGWAGDGLALATGVTLYVAATDLVPEVNKEVGHHVALTVLAGALLYVLTELGLRAIGIH